MVTRKGSNGADRLIGTSAADKLSGLGGDDFLQGGRGDDRISGGAGTDTASWADAGGRGSDGFVYGVVVDLGRGIADALKPGYQPAPAIEHDIVTGVENAIGSAFIDHLVGSAGANILWGQGATDWLEGGAGDDALHGGQGADSLFGDAGRDTLHGDQDADFLYGGIGDDRLYGDAGDDWLTGEAGRDALHGGRGDDRLFGGSSGPDDSDLLDGGAGLDIADYTGSAVGISADLALGRVVARGGTDRLTAVEGVEGSDHADLIRGDAGANRLIGGDGDDRVHGGHGNDRIEDGSRGRPAERNLLDGGDGDDVVQGGGGSDRIQGGRGADRVSGGTLESFRGAADQDRLDLGVDRAGDTALFELFDGHPFVGAFGVDRVAHFDPQRDVLSFFVGRERYGGEGFVVDVRGFLDSDDNGRIDAADREVTARGKDLVLDIGAVWERAMGRDLPSAQPQQVVLEGLAGGFAAARVDSQLDTHEDYTVLRESGDFLL
jgi:Ca2+-binding RTX toxin-like protein